MSGGSAVDRWGTPSVARRAPGSRLDVMSEQRDDGTAGATDSPEGGPAATPASDWASTHPHVRTEGETGVDDAVGATDDPS